MAAGSEAPQTGDIGTYALEGHLVLGLNEDGGAEVLDLALANRHGLITGATGTGKTVTLQVLAEAFSAAGVPVFAADIKGDLSGISVPGTPKPPLLKRVQDIGLEGWGPHGFPTVFWDVFGEQGHPVRATVQDMGPLVISRLLELSEAQEGVMNIAFRWAADQRAEGGRRMRELHLIDLDDLRAVLAAVAEQAAEIRTEYGNVAPASVGAIQRRLLVLEEQGANNFFGEPALDIADFLKVSPEGLGQVNILAADKLMLTPKLYSTFLLWMLTTLYEHLPEVGDQPKPKLVFFFDEAHLLFDDAPKALLDKIEQVTRLIRSKGVGVYYVTQNPRDVPDRVSAQLGNRIQHALRAFTPMEQRGIRAAAETFRPNPKLDTEKVIKELKTGEALVSTLRGKGEPSIVQRTLLRPPMGRIGPLTADERSAIVAASPFNGKYGARTERRSAHDILNKEAGTVSGVMADLKDTLESITSKVFGKKPR